MAGNCGLGGDLRRREKKRHRSGCGAFRETRSGRSDAPSEAHESLISRKTVAEVPLTGLSFDRAFLQGRDYRLTDVHENLVKGILA